MAQLEAHVERQMENLTAMLSFQPLDSAQQQYVWFWLWNLLFPLSTLCLLTSTTHSMSFYLLSSASCFC
jgi:hypothetical protein